MARSYLAIAITHFIICLALNAHADGEEPEQAPPEWRLGLRGVIGAATALGSFDDHFEDSRGAQIRFSSGGGVEIDRYLSRTIFVSSGAGVLDQGYRVQWDVTRYDTKTIKRVLYMRIPLMLAMDISKFQIGIGLQFDVGLYGRTVTQHRGVEEMGRWRDSDWDHHRRFNVAANLFAGQSIPAGPVILVHGFDFSMHLINNIKGNLPNGEALATTERHFVVLATIAVKIDLCLAGDRG